MSDKSHEGPAPFRFKSGTSKFNRFFIDEANGLRLRLHSLPEFENYLAVEPSSEAWPTDTHTYFKFMFEVDQAHEKEMLFIGAAWMPVPFDNDYPGRTGELLDVLLPTLCNVYVELDGSKVRTYGPISEQLRSRLDQNKSYSRHEERLGTYRSRPKG